MLETMRMGLVMRRALRRTRETAESHVKALKIAEEALATYDNMLVEGLDSMGQK